MVAPRVTVRRMTVVFIKCIVLNVFAFSSRCAPSAPCFHVQGAERKTTAAFYTQIAKRLKFEWLAVEGPWSYAFQPSWVSGMTGDSSVGIEELERRLRGGDPQALAELFSRERERQWGECR